MTDDARDTTTLKDEAGRFKAAFDSILEQYISTQAQRYSAQFNSSSLQALFEHLIAVCRGGKRLRPFMVFRLYQESHPGRPLMRLKKFYSLLSSFTSFVSFMTTSWMKRHNVTE